MLKRFYNIRWNGFAWALAFALLCVVGFLAWRMYQFRELEQKGFDRTVVETVHILEAAQRDNLAQGSQAEWFNLYAYLLYHVPHRKISPYGVEAILGDGVNHPCNCSNLNLGWVQLQNGAVVSGLTIFWDHAQPELMVPLCIDANGSALPNQSGRDVFIGRVYNRLPNTKAVFDWKSTHFGCVGKQYVSVQSVLNRASRASAPSINRK